MRFSQRIGKSPIKTIIQVETIDEDLKNRLWNVINEDLFNKIPLSTAVKARIQLFELIWKDFFIRPIQDLPIVNSNYYHFINFLRDWFFSAQWFEIYDLIEFLIPFDGFSGHKFVKACNEALTKEVSGYRIIQESIVQITSDQEIQTIEEALSSSDSFKPVSTHLNTALDLLSNRKAPNYRNSIKESISAVEGFFKIVTKDEKASFSKNLAILEKQYNLHPSLKEAYIKLYGYTSDADGIRHSILEDGKDISFDDAKFMLVLCTSFINYLKPTLKV